MSSTSMIHYFLQDDESQEVNMFMINKPLEQITPFDIIHNFPVPGKFHFRYRANITLGGSSSIIWMDTRDLNAPAPLFKGNIVIKALEYPPYVQDRRRRTQQKVYKKGISVQYSKAPPQEDSRLDNGIQQPPKQDMLLFESPKIIKSENQVFFQPPPQQNLQTPPQQNFQSPLQQNASLFPMSDPTDGLNREQLKARQEARINEKVNQHVKRVQQVMQSDQEWQQQKNQVDPELLQRLNNWEKRNHVTNNITVLLSTLHTVLWPNSGWNKLSAGDLLQGSNIKKGYAKAILLVHPDKRQNDSAEIRVISERVFQALNTAWRAYNSQ